jgi:hypothetical protein
MDTIIIPIKKNVSRGKCDMATKNYVNNKTLYEVMKKYHEDYQHAKTNDIAFPKIPDYVGEAILLIANKLSNKPNFSGYSYKDEMISDGIENCLMYLHNFDPNKTNNPFAYFTQIISYAFIRRIEKEKKQQYIKHKNLSIRYLELLYEDQNIVVSTSSSHEISNDFVKNYESRLTDKKKSAKVCNTVSQFFT